MMRELGKQEAFREGERERGTLRANGRLGLSRLARICRRPSWLD